jgi:hypothetical protein
MSSGTPQTRELASLNSDGVHVVLLWHPREDTLTVSVEDARVGDRVQLAVAPTVPSTPSTTPSPMRPNQGDAAR